MGDADDIAVAAFVPLARRYVLIVQKQDLVGLPLLKEQTIAAQGVRAALLAAGDTEIELLEPLDATSGIGRFLARRGEGLHIPEFVSSPDAGRGSPANAPS